ncbi:MAG: 2-amino-4-hydroxy-6-hydroxymethyldihydropteridine diphosphokinase [Nitrospinae bacterium]|nr:2-amino-4-hydroxy-6-hydroxymethyldihydropteridine diphosphokinase [Nitrospinota bacterium]MZH04289.1 2-amino-4-hydroxy-6-hydroxymethyldihydropteridine diphosphokinase [Nitrospinota bacterium]MZH14463.1 2-amino-4-hydroxy-6-hydroxymethyldihydropteridine diphosphokinase [Nitrospinota bacterium]
MTHRALIGVGSNLGLPAENCEKAFSLIDQSASIKVTARSSLYHAEPVGKTDQPWFVNAAVEVQTSLTPEELLQTLLDIERQFGRIREEKWGARVIDLDILDYDGKVIDSDFLTLPHPEMVHRRFVLEPLSEIAGSTIHPLENKTILDLLNNLPNKQVVKKFQTS